jgi:hypothetical protein
MGKD